MINMTNVQSEILAPEDYLKLSEFEKSNISRSRIIAPELGSDNFGKILIDYKIPVYKANYE